MKSFIDKYREFLMTDSNLSSMRLAFFWVVRTALVLSVVSPFLYLVAVLFDKNFSLAAVVALVATLLTTAFGGKSVQSFSEKDIPTKEE